MRVKLLMLLGFVGVVGAMESLDLGKDFEDSSEEWPVLKLALVKKRSTMSTLSSDPNSPYAHYENDARKLITAVSFFDRQYPEIEVSKTLKYYAETYPTAYQKFLARVDKIQEGTEKSEVDEGRVIIEFLQLMHAFRYDNANLHKEDKRDLKVANEGLAGEKVALEEQKTAQVTRTKNANVRSVFAGLGGVVVTVVTGLSTWFAHPNAVNCAVNSTMGS